MHLTLEVVEVESSHIHINPGADFRDGIVFRQLQGVKIGIFNVGLKVRLGIFLVLEINQAIEIKRQVIVVNLNLTFKTVFLKVAVQFHFIDMVAKQLRIRSHTIDPNLWRPFSRKPGCKIGVQVQIADKLRRIGHRARLHPLSIDVS